MTSSANLQQSAGDVRVESIYLNTVLGESIDLDNFFLEITLRESIYSPCMFGHVVITDSKNLIANAPIVGRDTITIKVRTPALADTNENIIYKTFAIYSITDRFLNSDREQFYTIHFMSIEGFKDSVSRISEKFSGSTDDLAITIFETYVREPRVISPSGDDAEPPTFYVLDRPHSTNSLEFVANYWSPMKCLSYIAKNTVGGAYKMPNTFFFESNKAFYFTSITALVQEQKENRSLYEEYSYVNNLDESYGGEKDTRSSKIKWQSPFISRKMQTVSKIDYSKHFDQLDNHSSGYYANTTHSYNWTTKDIYNIQFDYTPSQPERRKQQSNVIDYNFDSFKHIAQNNPILPGTISDPLSKRVYQPGASNLFGEKNAFDLKHVTSVCFRNSAIAELDAVKYEITVPGKTDIEVGRLIKFNYPNVGEKGSENVEYDKLFDQNISGVYIVTGIRHDIDKIGHNMILEIVRDSWGEFDA